jgi:starch synthase
MASALAEAGCLKRYNAPIAVPAASARRFRRVPGLGRGMALASKLRPVPNGLDTAAVSRTAPFSAVARIAGSRGPLPASLKLKVAEAYLARFDRRVAASMPDCDVAVSVQGSAGASLARAREIGATAVLNATLIHPAHYAALIANEARDRPAEAAELRGDQPTDAWLRRRLAELEHAERVLVPSTFARDTYAEAGVDSERLMVTPLGVNTDVFQPRSRPRAEGGFRALFVGRVSQPKGVGYLVEGFREAAIDGAELLIVGDLARSRPSWLGSPQIRHEPPVPRPVMPDVFRSADVVVMPSLAESFGLVVLEAMACGVPVIASECSLAPDVIREGTDGFIVPARDASAIAERLRTLAADPDLRERVGRSARARAEGFGWERYRQRIVETLRSV